MSETNNKIPLPGEPTPVPDFLKGDDWFGANVDDDFLDFDKPYRPPRYTLERNDVAFADVGEIHIVSGKPGNGKTGLMAQLIAATLGGQFGKTIARKVGHKVNGAEGFQEVPTCILYVDTEQGEDDTIGFKNRILSMSGVPKDVAKQHLKILRLRDTELALDRWKKILKAIWQVQPTDIFLDGMLDIVEDYNDQKECQPIIRKCMMLATHYDASLWAVLHENPMVDKLVGTLGSITQRKVSEIFTVIKVKQSELKEHDRNPKLPDIYFRVKQNKARGKDVDDWYFHYVSVDGGWGQPVEIEDNGQRIVSTKEMEMLKEADELFKAYNWTSTGATYTDLERFVRSKGVTSNRKISTLFNTAMENGIIYKSDKKKYHYKGLNAIADNDQAEILPFDKPEGEAPF
jgi:hypothetical protein